MLEYLSIYHQVDSKSKSHAVLVTVKGSTKFPNIIIFTKEYLQENEINTLCLSVCPSYEEAILGHRYNSCIGHIWLT